MSRLTIRNRSYGPVARTISNCTVHADQQNKASIASVMRTINSRLMRKVDVGPLNGGKCVRDVCRAAKLDVKHCDDSYSEETAA